MVAAVVAASAAGAQQTWTPFVGLGSASSAGPRSSIAGVAPLVVEPGALIESGRGSILARWSAPVAAQPFQLTDADLAMRARFFSGRRVEGSLMATAQYDHGSLDAIAAASSAVRLQFGTTGSSRGLQFGAGVDGWRSSINRNGVVVPATTISGWIRRFGLSFSAEISARSLPGRASSREDSARFSFIPDSSGIRSLSRADTVINPYVPSSPVSSQPSTPANEGRAFGEAALRVSGMLMSFGIDGHAGVGFAAGGQARGFGSIILTKWISPGFAFTGGVVVQPPEPGSSARRAGGLLGIRLASGPRLFPHFVNAPKVGASSSSVRVVDGNTTIEIRAPAASHVELSGDFTRWRPASLEHVGGDRWTLTTRLAPGLHRFVVRVDGGSWLPAPGLPQAVDAYEGTVSVIVAP
jgi:hypothetical protein